MTKLQNLGLKHLQAVVAVARYQSFMAAALELGISQPGISRLISHTEKELGVQLFTRTTRTVALTSAGREFVPAAERSLSDFAVNIENVRATAGQLRGRLTIAAVFSITQHVLPQAVVQYRREFPNIQIQIRQGMSQDVHEDVRSGAVDFAIGNASGVHESIAVDSIVKENLVAILPRDHPLARKRVLAFGELGDEQLISMPPESGLRRLLDGTATTYGVRLRHVVVVNQFNLLIDFVAAEMGISVIPISAIARIPDPAVVVRALMRPTIVRHVGILRLKERPLSPAASGFLTGFRPQLVAIGHRKK